ncbi:TraI/MobA(P) family conjugative relaxase [Serratia ficaria]|uniref:TraI/MobA(P) family conjugative relaxase n=1 Tax=Serratia ficaria TaxID=61651 RepID=UPI00077CB4A1|nr:TraI/MobA(P) family conjugative relaxase [Serratia ficaria]
MNAIIPPKRRDKQSSFVQLVAYVSVRDDVPLKDELKEDQRFQRPSRSRKAVFERLVDYMNRNEGAVSEQISDMSPDGDIRCSVDGVICQHNLMSVETAAMEMNSISMQNTHVKDAVYHYILSWQEDENPTDDQVFDSVKHSLKRLGMEEHQYVAAIHRDTDNLHVHIAANRVHPISFRAANVWNDADKLQRTCRELELKHGFKVDNGSWVRDTDNNIVRAKKGFRSAPRSARQLEHFSDQESLHAYAATHVRKPVNAMFREKKASWEELHEVLNDAGLMLEPHGKGLVVRDVCGEEKLAVKASRVHPGVTLARLEPMLGEFVPSPRTVEQVQQRIPKPYNDKLHVRDRGARAERRQARADARVDLRERYQKYRNAWKKPDLQAAERFRAVSNAFKEQKAHIRDAEKDAHMRKLMYHIVEFEREKSMAALRIELKTERQKLYDAGKMRPLSYRVWTEQQALNGDKAALSQLRGWAYRQNRKNQTPQASDSIIFCAPADDTSLLKADGYDTRLHRDGAVVYARNGQDAIIDRGDCVEVVNPYEHSDLNTRTAVDLVAWKSGERVEFSRDGSFAYAAGDAVAVHNLHHRDSIVVPSDQEQYDYTVQKYNQLKARYPEHQRDEWHQQYDSRYTDDLRHNDDSSYKP